MENYYYKLTDICEFQGGSQPPKEQWTNHYKDGYIRMLQIRDFTQNRVDEEFVKITNTIKTCNKDDVLIARYGASIGKILTGLEGAYNVAIMKSIPNESILNKRYMYYYFNTQYFQHNIKNVGSRAAQAGFNKTELESMQIYAPSLETQKKIVEVLDKAQEVIDKRKEQIKAMDELVKSRFIEMFGDPITNPKGWNTAKLGEICSISRGGSPRPIDEFLGGPIPWIKISDATKGDDIYIYKTKEGIIEDGVKKSRLIKKGGLIFANCGVSLGFARILKIDGCIHDGWLAFEDFEKSLDKIFFLKSLNYCTEYFRKTAPDGTQPNLNTSIMREYVQILPPMELQQEFTKFIVQVDKLKSQMESSLKELEDNFNSLMQKAFKGELF